MIKKLLFIFVLVLAAVCVFASCGHEHEWSDWQIISNSDCKTEGEKSRDCSCGANELQTVEVVPCDFIDDVCSMCKNKKGTSEGLLMENRDTSAVVLGIGACTDTEIVIPDYFEGLPVRRIKDEAFKGCKNITSVVMGDNITHIDSSAFENCTGLTNVTISDSVFYIGTAAFKKCSFLVDIRFNGDNLAIVGDSAFEGCVRLTQVPLSNIADIGAFAFKNCIALPSLLYFPESFGGSIGDNAFEGCSGIKTVVCSNRLEKIGQYAFKSCNLLESVYFGEGLSKIGKDAFPESPLASLDPSLSGVSATYPLSKTRWNVNVINYGFTGTITFEQPKPSMP